MVSVTFLAINLAGASIEEANTFLFKIKFLNHKGIGIFFLFSCIFLTVRYYGYAYHYHSKLRDFWISRMMDNYQIFRYNSEEKVTGGHIGKRIGNVWGEEQPGIEEAQYRIEKFHKRSITYKSEGKEYSDALHREVVYTVDVQNPLHHFNETWHLIDYLRVIKIETQYQFSSLVKYRESLDLLAPYAISFIAIISFFMKDTINQILQ